MNYAAHHTDFARYLDGTAAGQRDSSPKRSGFLRRIFDAINASRQRHADLEIGRFIAKSGGRLTDDIERRLMRRLTSSDWSMRE
jgi:hypothetical protein